MTNAKSTRSAKLYWHPGQPFPKFADRTTMAAIIAHEFFPISPRTLERWPIRVWRPNKSVVYDVQEALDIARDKMDARHPYRQTTVRLSQSACPQRGVLIMHKGTRLNSYGLARCKPFGEKANATTEEDKQHEHLEQNQ